MSNSIGFGAGDFGIKAGGNVNNSVGTSYSVIDLDNLEFEFSSIGIEGKTVDKSRGVAVGGTGIKCDIAIGCTVVGAEIIGNKYLMP